MSGTVYASVIVPAYLSHETIQRSLTSLTRQSFPDFELIVVDSSPDEGSERIVRTGFPTVRYHRSSDRLLPHQARNLGARLATGKILVFTDPDCVAEPDWLDRLARHHRDGREVVGGAMRGLPGWWDQAVHATKYGWWLPEARAGQRTELPSGNLSISRDAWNKVQGFQGQFFAGDSEICWRTREAGYEIWFDPSAVVTHLEHARPVAFARERFSRGKDFGRMRVRLRQWDRSRCIFYLIGSPILPWVMTLRSARYAIQGKYKARWLTTFPVQLIGLSLWCFGEACVHGAHLWKR